MKAISAKKFNELIKKSKLGPRLKKELRFGASTNHLNNQDWAESELVAITTRSGNEGVLLIDSKSKTFLAQYSILKNVSDKNGRSKPIICAFCNTWRAGNAGATIGFKKNNNTNVGYLCCSDLRCSDHVRDKTKQALISRTQLQENLNTEQRIERLKRNLAGLTATIESAYVITEDIDE